MQLARASYRRPAFAPAQGFGRGPVRNVAAAAAPAPSAWLSDDARLFASTFAAGFLFMTLFLA